MRTPSETGSLGPGGSRRVLVVLCVTEIVSRGVLYYAFPVLAPSIGADTGWSVSAITAGFSTGLVVSALVGIPAGRLLDRIGPRPVMTVGWVLAVPAVVGIALAPSLPPFRAQPCVPAHRRGDARRRRPRGVHAAAGAPRSATDGPRPTTDASTGCSPPRR